MSRCYVTKPNEQLIAPGPAPRAEDGHLGRTASLPRHAVGQTKSRPVNRPGDGIQRKDSFIHGYFYSSSLCEQ
jgi:hypothetical protein